MSRLVGGRYRILGSLGGGGTSLVYRAEVVGSGSEVALKELRPQFAADASLRRRFLREAELARGLDHPGIVRLLDAGEERGVPFLVLELVSGETLRERLDRVGRLDLPTAWPIFSALARALDHAHDRGVIHRDVKPQNVFLGESGVKLADFGNARVVSLASVTGASLTWGTPEYIAPEMFMRGRADPRSDLYALGVVLYEMLAGRLPFGRAETLTRLGNRGGSSLGFPPTGARRDIDALLVELLSFSPADRPASGEEARLRIAEPGLAAAVRTTCSGCGAPRPDDVPRCFSCGQEILRLAHDPNGRWRLVLETLADDAAATENLLRVLNPLARRVDGTMHFLTGNGALYSEQERRSGIAIPAVLFSHLDEATARTLESLFRRHEVDVRAFKGPARTTLPWGRRSSKDYVVSVVMGLYAAGSSSFLLGSPTAGIVAGAILTGIFSTAIAVQRRRRSRSALGHFELRDQIAAVPVADGLLATAAGATLRIQAPEVRNLLGDLSVELYRLTRRAEELEARDPGAGGSSEADLVRRTIDAAPALTDRLGQIAARLDALDTALGGPTEGELMHTLARLERTATAPGADGETLAAAREDTEAALERRHATEHERARLSARLCQMLGRLRQVYRRARAMKTPQEQEAHAVEAASAELEAFLGAGSR